MRDCRGELRGRVLRGLASDQEQLAFEAHLDGCESCRLALEVMGDFDPVGEAAPGDSERVARMAAAAIARMTASPGAGSGSARPPPRHPARRVWPLSLAALALSGAAVAGGAGWVALRSPTPPASPAVEAAPPARTSPPSVVAPAPASVIPPPDGVEVPTRAAPAAKSAPPLPPPADAAELYRAANEARRGGRTSDAIRSYQELQQRFPGSAEAHASRVSLGGLLLRSGGAAAALAQFDAYLRGGGRLEAEALFGRGRALEALGRSADEVDNWDTLVRKYPQSGYATHAQRRLDQLR